MLKKQHKAEIDLLKSTDLFSRKYYLWKHADVAKDKFWSQNPELHFLINGKKEARKCSKWFDTAWYLYHYDDVASEDINPLVHYLLYGQMEGRRISSQKYTERTRDEREKLRNSTIKHLWGGYSELALKELEDIYSDPEKPKDLRYFAAWHASRWYFYVQEYEKLLELGELIVEFSELYIKEKNTAMILTAALHHTGHIERAREVANNYLGYNKDDTDMLLILSNTYSDDVEKLQVINKIFEKRGLSKIEKKNPSLPLTFSNIYALATKRHHTKKLSVIMPTFNAEDKIESALRSILAQTWQNLEIIVVDDCSTDATVAVAQSVAKSDPRVRVFKQQRNGGAYLARNRGVKESTGDFITTHDSDDWSHPQKVEVQIDLLLRKPEIMGVVTYWTRAFDNLEFRHNWNLNERLLHMNHSSFLFRREVINDIGVWDSVIVGGDTEFFWRVQAHYGKNRVVKYKPKIPFSIALDDDTSLTRTKATHVNTIHLGLRYVYRASAKHWHSLEKNLKIHKEGEHRRFSAPRPMLKRGDHSISVEKLYISDFSLPAENENLYDLIQADVVAGTKIGLLHWPQYGIDKDAPSDRFFELLIQQGVESVVFGMEVHCETVVTLSSDLFKYKLEKTPKVFASRVTYLEDSTFEPENEVMDFIQESVN